MNWRRLYPGFEKICVWPAYFLICITCASATIGILYLQTPFTEGFQYLPAVAAALYFAGRLSFVLYYRLSVSVNEIIGYLFVLATGVALLGQVALGLDINDQSNRSSWSYTMAMWLFNIFYFFAGGACVRAKYKKSNLIAIVMVLLVAVPLIVALEGKLLLDYYRMRVATNMDGLNHLLISEWCVFFFIGAFGFAKPALRPVIIVVAVMSLFALQGRSSTLFTLVTLVSFSLLTEGRRIVYTLLGIVVVVLVGYFVFPVEELLFGANEGQLDRMLMSSEDGDNSGMARSEIMKRSLGHLPQSILFGDPTFIALVGQSMGSYIHNLLSMWQFFGLAPFVLMVVMLIRGLLAMRLRIKAGNLSVMEEIASMLLIYAAISVIASKSVVFYWLWFAAGYWMLRYSELSPSGRRRKRRKRRRRSKSLRSRLSRLTSSMRFG